MWCSALAAADQWPVGCHRLERYPYLEREGEGGRERRGREGRGREGGGENRERERQG